MEVYIKDAHEILEWHTAKIYASKDAPSWHCIYCDTGGSLYAEPNKRNIALSFLKENIEFDETYCYWLRTGEIFLLFKEELPKVKEKFESFLDFISENERTMPPAYKIWAFDKKNKELYKKILKAVEASISYPTSPAHKTNKKHQDQFPEKTAQKSRIPDKLIYERSMRYKPLLLIIEDELTAQYFLETIMEPYCDIITATTAAEARTLYQERLPNIVFMDIKLPDGDGQELTEDFLKLDPSAFIIMVSGHISRHKIIRCLSAGAKGFVAKPISPKRLIHFIDIHNKNRTIPPMETATEETLHH